MTPSPHVVVLVGGGNGILLVHEVVVIMDCTQYRSFLKIKYLPRAPPRAMFLIFPITKHPIINNDSNNNDRDRENTHTTHSWWVYSGDIFFASS